MPSSYHGHITDVIDLYLKANPDSVLDIGVGFGKWGVLFREYGDIFKGRLHPDKWNTIVRGVEIFKGYKNVVYDYVYDVVYFMDIQSYLKANYTKHDFVYAGDVIEHLEKDVAISVIKMIKERSKQFVLSIPLSDKWPQGEVFGNEFETHRSMWEETDLTPFFSNKKIYHNPAGKPLGLFWN